MSNRPRGYIADYRPQEKTKQLLGDVLTVLDEYREHWPLTIRQVFYRLVGAYGADKSEGFYGKLCHHLANARRAGVIPFSAIRDDGVMTLEQDHFADADAFRAMVRRKAENYQRDLMAAQPVHIELWCEAAGMIQQLYRVATRFSVPVYSSSGFDSLTAKKTLADRICATGKPAVVLHLGDHDPSGESLFDVIAEDVGAFVAADRPNSLVTVQFQRIGLTAGQVRSYGLPTAPAKATDSRSKRWTGGTCQLEALAPDQIAGLVEDAIRAIIDADLMQADLEAEKRERRELTRLLPSPESFTTSRNSGGKPA
jgi:hypothetical protein